MLLIFGLPQMKQINFFNFSEICVIFAQICIFQHFSFFKGVLNGVKKYVTGKILAKNRPINVHVSAHIILEYQTQISAKKQNPLGVKSEDSYTIFKSRFFSTKFKTIKKQKISQQVNLVIFSSQTPISISKGKGR